MRSRFLLSLLLCGLAPAGAAGPPEPEPDRRAEERLRHRSARESARLVSPHRTVREGARSETPAEGREAAPGARASAVTPRPAAPPPRQASVTAAPPRRQVCEEVPAPRQPRFDPLPTVTPRGRVESTLVDGFNDDYLYGPDEEFKIGTRREWGSTVIFFGHGGNGPGINPSNTIDANDTGRELQVALYDYARGVQGCAWNASCLERPETACGKEITFLGWNPVQGGDECNRGSGTESVVSVPGRLDAKVVPRFWNPDWKLEECINFYCDAPFDVASRSDVRYRQRLRFVGAQAVEMFMEFTNLSDLDHAPAYQEFPTLYSSFGKVGPDLWKVMDSEGNRIRVDEPSNNNFLRKRFDSPGGWAALQNSALTYGVGLYYETRQSSYQAWQRRHEFNNFRARFRFGLPAYGKVRARAYLLIGSYENIRRAARRLDRKIGPFGELEAPLADAEVGDKMIVSGWALDNWDVTDVELRLDGKPLASAELTEERPDVCTTWPGYEMCRGTVGFRVEADLSRVSRCGHLLEVLATDTDGNSRTIARQRIFVKNRPSCRGAACEPAGAKTHPIYRSFWTRGSDRDHQFSRDDRAPGGYQSEGEQFRLFSDHGDGLVPLWQSWCASCTDHLQTLNAEEGAPRYTGAEILGFCSRRKTREAPRRLRRLNSAAASDHFVSADPAEWETAAAEGYAHEGSCWVP